MNSPFLPNGLLLYLTFVADKHKNTVSKKKKKTRYFRESLHLTQTVLIIKNDEHFHKKGCHVHLVTESPVTFQHFNVTFEHDQRDFSA